MLTCVVAKQANTTKVKNKFVHGKKSSKEYSVAFLMEGEKFNLGENNLGDKVQAKSSNLPRRFCSNSVGTPLEFAAFRSGFNAKYSRASAFFYGVPNIFCQEKHQHFHADRQLVMKKQISIKINLKMTVNAHGLVDLSPASHADEPGSALGEGRKLFFFFFLFNDLNESIFTNL